MDLDQVFNQDKMKKTSDELRAELNKAENQIKSFDLKWKHQNQAIQTAKQELHKLHKTQDSWLLEKEKLQKELDNEQHRSKQLEQEIQQLKQNQQQEQKGGLLDSFQVRF
jgi:chromosome segregation ATPase